MPRFYVVSGTFPKLKYAVPYWNRVKAAGFDAKLIKASDGAYKVQLGDFPEAKEATLLYYAARKKKFPCVVTDVTPGTDVPAAEALEYIEPNIQFAKLDKVKVAPGALMYGSSRTFDEWVSRVEFYVRYIDRDCCTIALEATGPTFGNVHKKYLTKV